MNWPPVPSTPLPPVSLSFDSVQPHQHSCSGSQDSDVLSLTWNILPKISAWLISLLPVVVVQVLSGVWALCDPRDCSFVPGFLLLPGSWPICFLLDSDFLVKWEHCHWLKTVKNTCVGVTWVQSLDWEEFLERNGNPLMLLPWSLKTVPDGPQSLEFQEIQTHWWLASFTFHFKKYLPDPANFIRGQMAQKGMEAWLKVTQHLSRYATLSMSQALSPGRWSTAWKLLEKPSFQHRCCFSAT